MAEDVGAPTISTSMMFEVDIATETLSFTRTSSAELPHNREWPMSRDTKKPTNLHANAMPADGYVLTVDGKL